MARRNIYVDSVKCMAYMSVAEMSYMAELEDNNMILWECLYMLFYRIHVSKLGFMLLLEPVPLP